MMRSNAVTIAVWLGLTLCVNQPVSAAVVTAAPSQVSKAFSSNGAPASSPVTLSFSGSATAVTMTPNTVSGGNWLSVTPVSGIVGGGVSLPLSISIDPSGLPDGTYLGNIHITSASTPVDVSVLITVGSPGPQLSSSVLMNGVPLSGGISAGAILTLSGSGIGPATPYDANFQGGTLQTKIAGTGVWFDNTAAALVFVHPGQVAAIVPYDVVGKSSVQVSVETMVTRTLPLTLPVQNNQGSCTYSPYGIGNPVAQAGGNVTIVVGTSAAACGWTASPGANWINCGSATPQTGSGAITCAVASNSADQRSANVTIGSASLTITQSGSHPGFFSGEVSLGNGIYYLQMASGQLFGYYSYLPSSFIYHQDMGYEYVMSAGGATNVYLWDLTTGHWFYTDSGLFPYLYDFTLQAWLFYFPDTKNPGHYTQNPRYFANTGTGQIFPM